MVPFAPWISSCSGYRMSRDHTKLQVFRQADALVLDIYEITRVLPPEERFGLQTQIRRAAISVPTNIVEGAVRRSESHFLQYLETALGSACETRYLLELALRLQILDPVRGAPLVERYSTLIRGLAALRSRITDNVEASRRGYGGRNRHPAGS